MANVIDALVTTLTLDNTGFRKGTREALSDQQKIREAGKSTADSVQSANQRMAQSFTTVRNEVVGLFLALAGARTIKDFTANIINGDAATGRLANNLGIATEKLSAWEGAIGRVGGNAKSADAALQSMVSAVQDYKLTGKSAIAGDLMGLGVTQFNDPTQMLLQIAKAGERMNRPEFAARLSRLGFDQDTINLLGKGRDGLEQLLREQEKLGVVTDKDAKAAQEFESAMAKLTSTVKGEARPQITALANGLVIFLGKADEANVTTPVLTGAIGALGVAALVAAGPYTLLAAAIAAAALAYERFTTASGRQRVKENWEADKKAFGDLLNGDPRKAWDDFWNVNRSKSDGMRGGASITAPAVSVGGDALFERLIHQESGGRAGISGPMTRYGQAHGLTQMLDSTAASTARRIGVPWRPELMRGTSAEAIAYQRKLGRAYFDEGMRRYNGDARKALMFYHGGPNERIWGAKTNAYANAILGPQRLADLRRGNAANASGSSVSIGQMTVVSPNPQSFANKDLPDALRNRGLIVQAGRGVTP